MPTKKPAKRSSVKLSRRPPGKTGSWGPGKGPDSGQPTNGIEGILFETHNWGKSVAFWKALGYRMVFETNHHSGELRHPAGGPYIFIAERPPSYEIKIVTALYVKDTSRFEPPKAGAVKGPFKRTHWGTSEMQLQDPDGRMVSIQGPPPRKAKKGK